ncbi:PorP/SprF family type IX secretion system membrane protein [Ferruginibacter albus]|uniref:PorP/SprF family type IX secretion system membrane protein n=1 Tax=Ferruginibacter albus TaxID=2875540 RepID=UPI001CC402BE|nr:PorP/SprF family type IX secretion system membrane protein [Ferruginibacter albus]UAY51407.1 PorP/SprF family type IX secretion system membrane protein [Ferruginibacter albus]
MRNLILLCLLAVTVSAKAQDPHFSQFFASPLTLNPALTGKFDGQFRFEANHRDQWPSIPNAYVTTSASIDFPILKKIVPENDRLGVGISGLSDQSADGALNLNYGSLSVSYHKALSDDGFNTIGAGLQATYSSLNIDMAKLTFEDQLTQNGFTGVTSEVLTNGNNVNYFDIGAGLLFSGSTNGENNYYIGASMYHINQPQVGFQDKNWILLPRTTLHAGGTFPLNDQYSVSASIIQQFQNEASETVFGGALGINLNHDTEDPTNFYIGSWYRWEDAAIPYVGLEFNGWRLGASYDINISSLKAATQSRGGTEFSLIYIKKTYETKGIPCPTF